MLSSQQKISPRQAMILFFMTTLSAAIRLYPQYTARMAGKAGWLAPMVAAILMLPLIFIVLSFYKKKSNSETNLSDIYCSILGKFAGKAVLCIYLAWLLLLLALYIRYYAERLLSSILPNTSMGFLVISILVLVFWACKSGLVPIARANEIFFVMFIVIFVIVFLLSVPNIRYRNLMVVSYLDVWPVMKASYVILAIRGYFLFIFFIGDRINNKEHLKRFALQGVLLKASAGTLFLIMTIGSLGPILTSRMSLPFFIAVKNISALGAIERIESIVLALWVISDFTVITMFAFFSMVIIKNLFNLSEVKHMASPVLLLGLILAMYLAKNRFELENFSTYIALPANMLFEYMIPIIVFVIGKIRKKI